MDENNANAALIERVERVVETLQDNSIKMGQLLAVHDEKLDKQDRIDAVLFAKVEQLQKTLDRETELIKAGCERDIRKVDDRLRVMEKKMWSIFGGLAVISFVVSVPGQKFLRPMFQSAQTDLTVPALRPMMELPKISSVVIP